MQYKDYYAVLGVSKDATTRDIKSAYRKLARKFHPDVNPGDKSAEEKYKEINEAYTVLSDEEKRKKYDRYGADWENISQGMGGNFGDFDFFGGGMGGSGFSSFFDLLFSQEGGPSRGATFNMGGNPFGGGFGGSNPFGGGNPYGGRPADLEYDINVSMETVYFGGEQVISVNGKELTVTVPKGIPDGYKLKLRGMGNRTQAGNSDLILNVHVLESSSAFERVGNDLLLNAEVDYLTAILGGEVSVRTMAGKTLTVTVPSMMKTDTKMRIPGKGMPVFGGDGYGDLYLVLKIRIPEKISDEEKELLTKIRECRRDTQE
ncbi:MAG: J domain-containing protein [Armatimonadetes bacterium]|nr:J domain-containing protein [Candidatus Hippobium faecium]